MMSNLLSVRIQISQEKRTKQEMRTFRKKLSTLGKKSDTVAYFENLLRDGKKMERNIIQRMLLPKNVHMIETAPVDKSSKENTHEKQASLYFMGSEQQADESYMGFSENTSVRPEDLDSRKDVVNSDEDNKVDDDDDMDIDDDEIPSLSIDMSAWSVKAENNPVDEENDSRAIPERTEKPEDNIDKGEEEDVRGIGEYESFELDMKNASNESMTMTANGDDDDVVGTRAVEANWKSCLSAVESFVVGRTLEKWIDRVSALHVIEGPEDRKLDSLYETFYDDTTLEGCWLLRGRKYVDAEASANLMKMSELREFVLSTLTETVRELMSHRTFNALRRVIDVMLKTVHDQLELKTAFEANQIALNVLRNKKKRHKQRHNEKKWRIESKTLDLAKTFQKTTELIEMENQYVQTWEDRLSAENKEFLDEQDNQLRKQIQVLDYDIKIEDNCLREARQVFSHFTEATNMHLDTWETLYSKHVGAIDVEILTLEQTLEDLEESYDKLRADADELQAMIDELEAHKRVYEERIRIALLKNEMAIKIQAFWRGTMVRKFFGPYKKLKKLFKKKLPKKAKKPKKLKKTK